jgi:hypothetical protein
LLDDHLQSLLDAVAEANVLPAEPPLLAAVLLEIEQAYSPG